MAGAALAAFRQHLELQPELDKASEIGEALLSSLSLALGGAALCLVLAVPVGLLVVRYKGPLAIWRTLRSDQYGRTVQSRP